MNAQQLYCDHVVSASNVALTKESLLTTYNVTLTYTSSVGRRIV